MPCASRKLSGEGNGRFRAERRDGGREMGIGRARNNMNTYSYLCAFIHCVTAIILMYLRESTPYQTHQKVPRAFMFCLVRDWRRTKPNLLAAPSYLCAVLLLPFTPPYQSTKRALSVSIASSRAPWKPLSRLPMPQIRYGR